MNTLFKKISSLLVIILPLTGCNTSHISSNEKITNNPKSNIQDEKTVGLEVVNLNTKDNSVVTLILPEKWTVTIEKRPIVAEFKFKQDKNKNISYYNIYSLFDEKNEQRSKLSLVSYYIDQANGAALPNHCSIKEKAYEGETKLGNGIIYLLNCDLPKEQITNEYTTYDRVYALIPIEGEDKAYNLDAPIPLGEKPDKYVNDVKSILETK